MSKHDKPRRTLRLEPTVIVCAAEVVAASEDDVEEAIISWSGKEMMDATDNAVLGKFSKFRNPEQPLLTVLACLSRVQANYLTNLIH